eukprot:806158-Heterocapsa_arctica.AAC.1
MACRKRIRDKEDISKQAKQAKHKVFENKQVEVGNNAADPIEPYKEDGESKGPPTILEVENIAEDHIEPFEEDVESTGPPTILDMLR